MSVRLIRDHVIDKALKCPFCHHGASNALGGTDAPKVGDFTICVDCGGVNRFAGEPGALSLQSDLTMEQLVQFRRALAPGVRITWRTLPGNLFHVCVAARHERFGQA